MKNKNNNDDVRGYEGELAFLQWEAEQERKSEDMLLGIYEEGISVDEYQRYTQRW